MDQFADIRPYHDSEVPQVLARLLAEDEFISAIGSLRLGRWARLFSIFLTPLIRRILKRELQDVTTVSGFQDIVKKYMDRMVDDCTSAFTVSGIDELDPDKAYLFMSNHRDIALDPAFVNYALYHNNRATVRIAIGDNLLTKPFISDLMRINKSFIVHRSAKGPRQIFAAYKKLSGYIKHSIEEERHSIWIAQREGRAKDGIDRTEPAIIKMLSMCQQKDLESFSDYINKLHIVPVSISYELDPCDGAKARELYEKAKHGHYKKAEHEDAQSISLGITGDKGHVHVSFGKPIAGEFENAEQVATAVDRQVLQNYVLHPSNFFAYKMLNGDYPEGVYSEQHKIFSIKGMERREQEFKDRINSLPEEHRPFALGIYANSINQKTLSNKTADGC